jgi:hypothetical protein
VHKLHSFCHHATHGYTSTSSTTTGRNFSGTAEPSRPNISEYAVPASQCEAPKPMSRSSFDASFRRVASLSTGKLTRQRRNVRLHLKTAISISDQYWDAAFSFTITSLGTVPGMTGGICAKKLTCLWRSVTLINGGWAFCSSQPQDVTRRTSDETIPRFDPARC